MLHTTLPIRSLAILEALEGGRRAPMSVAVSRAVLVIGR